MERPHRLRSAFSGAAAALAIVAASDSPAAAERRLEVRPPAVEATVDGPLSVPEDAVVRWIDDAAAGVTAYLGRYPVPHARLYIRTGGRGAIGHGVTFGGRVVYDDEAPLASVRRAIVGAPRRR